MRKETINKIALKDPKKQHIEIFSNQRYKDYYLRGRIDQFSHYIYDDKLDEDCAAVSYRFAIVVLVNDKYQEKIKKERAKNKYTSGFFENTERDFLNAQKAYWEKKSHAWDRKDRKSLLREVLKEMVKPTLMISLDEAGIKETPYLDESIKAKKDIILLDMDFVLNKIEILSPKSKMIEYAKRIYTIPAFYFPTREEYASDYYDGWLEGAFEEVYWECDYNYLDQKEYYRILESIGNLSYEWIKRMEVTKRYLESLNRLNEGMGDRDYPLTNFCYKFLDDLVDDPITQKQIGKCQFCGGFFKFTQWNKKHCSLKSEGKDCGKEAAYDRDYEKHGDKRRAKAREYARKQRGFSKKLGVKE